MNDVRLIAFYLPQFHPIDENDAWWGKGFTEWTNVASAKPLFPGHYQPHIPADLGFYDLRLADTRESQAQLARSHGIYGFCYYYYYFNGKRLLNRPLDEVIASGRPDFPFCVCWANENWTRKWDGLEHDILIRQAHSRGDDQEFIRQLIPVLKDKRYIRVNNKLLVLVYRTELLPDPKVTSAIWREYARKEIGEELYLCTVNNFVKELNPVSIGFDGMVQFPLLYTPEDDINKKIFTSLYNVDFQEIEYNCFMNYPGVVNHLLKVSKPDHNFFRGVFPSWDNTPRRQKASTVYMNSSPELYKLYLKAVIGLTMSEHSGDERMVFINAWNEWAEGAHLEPDKKYGLRYLEATREAVNENNDYKLLMEEINQRDTESRMFYSSVGHLTEKLAITEEKLNELTRLTNEKNIQFTSQLNSLTQKLEDKDQVLAQFSKILAQKELEINEKGHQIVGKENLINEIDRQLKETMLKYNDLTNRLKDHDQLRKQLENSLEDSEKLIRSKELVVMEQEKLIREKEGLISSTEQKLRNAEELNADRQRIITSKEVSLQFIYNSLSWRITKPFRCLLARIFPIFYFFFPYGSRRWSVVKSIIQKIHRVLFKPNRVQGSANLNPVEIFTNEYPEMLIAKGTPETSFMGSHSILFIGHDAFLAGAQVILLSLIKWFTEHTGIKVKLILLGNGILLDKFNKISPVLVWSDFVKGYPDKETRQSKLVEFLGNVNLIYGNTVVVPSIYDELKFLGAPYITHVHELEKSIRMYVDVSTVEKMRLYTNGFVACSDPVEQNLVSNHHINPEKIVLINEFIEKKEINFNYSKKDLRKKLGLKEEVLIVLGCGTIYLRKGTDLFIETASMLKKRGISDFHFYWLGDNVWDNDVASLQFCPWKDLEKKIEDEGLTDYITFLGLKNNPMEYFLSGDMFYLPSREDPYPLVCLEAAQCRLPVICFEDAGGMPDFVQNDAGFVVPFEDVDQVVEKIIFLDRNKTILNEMGKAARKKFLERHTIDTTAPGILEFCHRIGNMTPVVSVVVPNYNHGKYLGKRIDSILNQTFQDFEIILLDDASSDNSQEVIKKYLDHPNVRFFGNQINSGNAFKQWHKGFLEAKGEIIWFAEADDFCEPDFLQNLLPCFNIESVALAYCDTLIVDESDNITGDYNSWVDNLDAHHWKTSYQVTGEQEINYGLGVKNSIPNASGVLIRKNCITEEMFRETFQYKYSGDWFFYTKVIKGKEVAYHAKKLNYQRKHSKTVTTNSLAEKSGIQMLLKEQESIHRHILQSFPIDPGFFNKWKIHITDQSIVAKDDYYKFYPYKSIEEKIIKATAPSGRKNKRIIFLTTNDGVHDGGSEQLWIQTAIECRRREHQVRVIIKKWDPAPYFFKVFQSVGISIIYKENIDFAQVIDFNPDLMIISTGDQDEGIEWYNQCITNNIDYVIINQLTKEPEYWPVRPEITGPLKNGYLRAKRVFFTSENNHRVMEKRLDYKIPNTSLFYQPFFVDRKIQLPFPTMEDGIKMALPARLLMVHKGQHLALEVLKMKKWKQRNVHLNFYGSGPDEDNLKNLVAKYELTNVSFYKPRWTLPHPDLFAVWRDNHAILMPSFMEGMPLVLLNAMVCARVPIVTNVGGHAEIIENNVNGFIAAKPTVADLDDAMERAYSRVGEWEEIGLKARQTILNYLPEDPIDHFVNQIIPLT